MGKGTLKGHNGWVTQIATSPQTPDQILSSSRDKTLILWELTRNEMNYGIPKRSLKGHNHFVSDVVMSSDGQFALCGTLWVSANTPSRTRVTLNGSQPSDFHQTQLTQSLSLPVGISLSRCGILQTAS